MSWISDVEWKSKLNFVIHTYLVPIISELSVRFGWNSAVQKFSILQIALCLSRSTEFRLKGFQNPLIDTLNFKSAHLYLCTFEFAVWYCHEITNRNFSKINEHIETLVCVESNIKYICFLLLYLYHPNVWAKVHGWFSRCTFYLIQDKHEKVNETPSSGMPIKPSCLLRLHTKSSEE